MYSESVLIFETLTVKKNKKLKTPKKPTKKATKKKDKTMIENQKTIKDNHVKIKISVLKRAFVDCKMTV